MITFADTARMLNVERRKNAEYPERAGFIRNRKGVFQKNQKRKIILSHSDKQPEISMGLLCYADQSSTDKSIEGELIQQKVWKPEDVGWLWVFVLGKNYVLAKISPAGVEPFRSGYVSERGDVIIHL